MTRNFDCPGRTDEGKVEKLSDRRADLPGVGVDRVAAHKHQVVRSRRPQRGRQRTRRG
jgi:hypothetical protein